jgi:hypothetical protein
MTPELQKYYEERFSMFSQQGWIDLMEDVDKMLESLNNISTIEDGNALQFRKGELSILLWVRNLKQISERAYEDLRAEANL